VREVGEEVAGVGGEGVEEASGKEVGVHVDQRAPHAPQTYVQTKAVATENVRT
jgi:hypothetical protein